MGEDKSIYYGRYTEIYKSETSWENFRGGTEGYAESLWRRETCELKRGGQLVGSVPYKRKIKRRTGKGPKEIKIPEKSGIERGEMHKGDDARPLVEVWNKRAWGHW